MAATSSPFDPEGPLAPIVTPANPGNKPALTLVGKHVTLTPLHLSHAPSLYTNVGGLEHGGLWKYMPTGPYTDLDSFKGLIEKLTATPTSLFPFAIFSPEIAGETAIGITTLMNINPSHHTIEIGHVLYGPTLQRTTAATEAVYLLMKWAFEHGYQRLEWKCNDWNEPSKRAALRLGFEFEGVFRKHMVVKGRRRDTAWYSVTDEEWEQGGVKEALELWMDAGNFDGEGRQKRKLEEIREGLGKRS